MDADALRAEISSLAPWHHDVEVAPGIFTGQAVATDSKLTALGKPTLIDPGHAARMVVDAVFPEGLQGRSVLDCACNAGGYLFAAASLGAGRSFGFDVRDHWIRQAHFLARHLPGERIEFATCDLADLPGRGLEPFDVTWFNGLFYHLPDPVAGLRIAADLTRELLVVNTAAAYAPGHALVLSPESRTLAMSGVHGLAWLPSSDRVVREILAWCGFPHTRLQWKRRPSRKSWRMQVLAAREAGTFAHFDARNPSQPEGRISRRIRRLLGRE